MKLIPLIKYLRQISCVFVLVLVAWVNDTIFRTDPLRSVDNKQMKTFSWIRCPAKFALVFIIR